MEDLKRLKEEYETVFNGTQDAMFLVEVLGPNEFRYIRANAAYHKDTGVTEEQLQGKTPQEVWGDDLGNRVVSNYKNCVESSDVYVYEEMFPAPVDRPLWHSVLTPVIRNGRVEYLVGSSRNITEQRKHQKEAEYLSFHDPLTGLYNRRFFEEELSRLDTGRNLPLTFVMVDVNGLKLANDAFGHDAGDKILIRIANAIKSECRSDDIIARTGGDEFVLLLPNTDPKAAEALVNRIRETVENDTNGTMPLSAAFGWETKRAVDENMVELMKKAEDNMYRCKLMENANLRNNTLGIIIRALFEKNDREEKHAESVSKLSVALAEAVGLPTATIKEMGTIGRVHDIGKISIDDRILEKPDRLDENEWSEIRRHAEIGYRILSAVSEYSPIANLVLQHHERWDGKGYPSNLKENEISEEARIIAIADAYDAMTTDKPYQPAMTKEEAIHELRKNAGSQFDPTFVEVFINRVCDKYLQGK
jgi:diguanylate cyclase (GGDEF)-like protein/PAS domain S-box-containing protein